MANIYSLKSGNASDTTVWSGGVVPVSGDRVLISSGHTVTLDGTYEWGDDTISTIVINTVSTTASIFIEGTLKASRSVNSQLTGNGHILVNARTGVFGMYDCGTAADPIPDGVTHTCILNKSAVLANGKYGFQLASSSTNLQGKFSSHGVYRKRNAALVGAVSVGATSAVVSDATGWAVGDQIIFAPTTTYNYEDIRTISTITAGSGTQATITFAALTYAHADTSPVGNFTSNVTFKPYSTAGSGWSYMYLSAQTTSTTLNAGDIHCSNTRIEGGGANGSDTTKQAALVSYQGGTNSTVKVMDDFDGLALFATGSSGIGGQFSRFSSRQRSVLTNSAFYGTLNTVSIYEYSVSVNDFDDVVVYRSGSNAINCAYSQGSINNRHYNIKVFGTGSYVASYGPAFAPQYFNCVFGPIARSAYFYAGQCSANLYENCDFGVTFGRGVAAYLFDAADPKGISEITLRNCTVASGITTRPTNYYLSLPAHSITIENLNNNVTAQEFHIPQGSFYRDNSVEYRGTSSIRLEPDRLAGAAMSRTIAVPAPNGVSRTVVGYLRKNSSYGGSTMPSVTLSGLGITPQTFIMSNSVDTWEKFTLTATQTSGADGNLSLTFSAQSANSGAVAYFDGVPLLPFITSVRHFGYVFDGNSYRTTDTRITISEATALALPVTIDHTAQTITVTGAVTNAELFQACMADLCKTANLTRDVHVASADGVGFTTTYTVVNISNVSGTFTHAPGTVTTITAANLLSGSRVQVYNVTDATELLNTTLSGAGASVQVTYTSAKTIRLRAALENKLPLQAFGVLSAAGLAFIDSQQDDAVYVANAIDGSTVTEFAPDGPNIQVDINDADNVTQVQRLYAWAQHYSTTSAGVASAFFLTIQASDEVNYDIDQALADVKLDNTKATPLLVQGGRLARKDGSTVIAATSGSIQIDPGRAYIPDSSVSSASEIADAVWAKTLS